jgi:basic amino acid/polyamine antiporter, APA family
MQPNSTPETEPPEPPQLVRALGTWGATAIVVGIMIGSAIFIVPAEITREVGSARGALAVWLVTGVLSLFGALSFAELAAMMPQAGGQYIYLREGYGPLVSFLCGWMFFLIQQSGGIATLAVGMAQYLGNFLPLGSWGQKAAAAGAILILTAINVRGVRQGGWVQSLLTGVDVGIAVALIAVGLSLVVARPSGPASLPIPSGTRYFASFGVAMVAALWAYEGWNNVTFAAGEVKRPERTLPLALILGTGIVIAIYLGLNLVYYRVLTLPEIAASPRVAADAMRRLVGPWGSQLTAVAIVIAVFGSLNGSILAGARVYYAMAKDGLFFRWCAAVHPRFRTPHVSLVVQGLWSCLLVLLANYEQLFTYTVFAAWIFYALTALAVIILRRSRPDLPRPYRVPGYPVVPILFVLTAAAFVANTLVEKTREAGFGTLLVLAGIPVYWFWRRKHPRVSELPAGRIRDGAGRT